MSTTHSSLNPDEYRKSKRRWGSPYLVFVLVSVSSVLITLGVLRMPLAGIPRIAPTSPATAGVNDSESQSGDILVADIQGQRILLLFGTDDAYTEIKVATTTTNTRNIQELTRGKFEVLSAALSPSGDQVAYIREEGGKRTVEIIDRGVGQGKSIDPVNYWAATYGQTVAPCFWSPIVWSPDSAHFAFFGCTNTLSMLIVVEAAAGQPLPVNEITQSSYPGPRQLSWFDEASLIHTRYNPDSDTTTAYRFFLDPEVDSLIIYER